MKRATILLVDDDVKTQQLIKRILELEGYLVRSAPNIFRAQGEVARHPPDLVLLDRRLPDGDGADFCKELRASDNTKGIPVIFLTVKDSASDHVAGLEIGGDDYLPKPFFPEVLVARVAAMLRRANRAPEPSQILTAEGLRLDIQRHECLVDGKPVPLWPKEFELLQIFMERPGRLLSREYLCERVWGHEYMGGSRAIETAVQRLRHKLGRRGDLIETLRGYGFKFNSDP
ncbi:MAG: response regulator transcription factor [Elusimicrobia bacterium]|nr:response regulator transcription factor [Elusimicrobiota bacterium]